MRPLICIYHSEVDFGIDNYIFINDIFPTSKILEETLKKKVVKTGFYQKRNRSERKFCSFELEWEATDE